MAEENQPSKSDGHGESSDDETDTHTWATVTSVLKVGVLIGDAITYLQQASRWILELLL